MASQQPWDSHPSLIPKNALAVDLTRYEWTNSQLVFDFTLKCFYLSSNLVYFSHSALPPDHPRHVYIEDNRVFQSDWTNLLLASKGKQILINQEAVAKQTEAIKGYTPLPLHITKHIHLDIITILSPVTPITSLHHLRLSFVKISIHLPKLVDVPSDLRIP